MSQGLSCVAVLPQAHTTSRGRRVATVAVTVTDVLCAGTANVLSLSNTQLHTPISCRHAKHMHVSKQEQGHNQCPSLPLALPAHHVSCIASTSCSSEGSGPWHRAAAVRALPLTLRHLAASTYSRSMSRTTCCSWSLCKQKGWASVVDTRSVIVLPVARVVG